MAEQPAPHRHRADDSSSTEERTWLGRVRELPLPAYLEKWRQRFRTHPQTGLPLTPLRQHLDEGTLNIEQLAFSTGKGLRWALKLFAPACFLVFVVSFWTPIPWLEEVLRACSTAGLIGFGTNWVAIKMLFRPRDTRPIFGQGLIPSQRDQLIAKVVDEVVEKLINEEIINRELDESRLISRLTEETAREVRQLVRDPEFVRDTKQMVLTYASKYAQSEAFREEIASEVEMRIESVAGTRLAHRVVGGLRGLWREPMLRLVNKELDELPETLDRLVGEIDSALDHIPGYLESHQYQIDAALTRITMALIREIDVRQLITKQLSTVTSDQLEQGFREFADDKLSYITLLGGILGLIGGLVIIWPVYSIGAIVALIGVLVLMDLMLHAVFKWLKGPETQT
ncbi:MAG: DUF445 family protein [Myxococcota bacterium]